MLSNFALADTYEFDLGEKAKAIRAYEAMRAAVHEGAGKSSDPSVRVFLDWWDAWLGHETRFLRSGTRVSRPVPREESLGLFAGMLLLPGVEPRHPALTALLRRVESGREKPDRDAVRSTLDSLPASRLILMRTVALLAYLEPDEMVAYLERHDPSRFWSASLLTMAVLITADPASCASARP